MKAATEAVALGLAARGPVLGTLAEVVALRVPGSMEARLAEIRALVDSDLAAIERDIDAVEQGGTPMHDSAGHLLALGGKRLRPICVALASRVGAGFGARALDLAVASELVHSATLLHDDVVDVGDKRRGAPTARVLYGNAASVYAGDWLLVEALLRVRRAGYADVLDQALGVLAEMLEAEALQLKHRGRVDVTMDDYLRIVRGKTASLFRWALFAGARAGELSDEQAGRLSRFGQAVGVAFQAVDDALDVDGDPEVVGKELLSDLAEGKVTYPLMIALEKDQGLARALGDQLCGPSSMLKPELCERARRAIVAADGAAKARAFAEGLVQEALLELSHLPDKPATRALGSVALAIVNRRK